MFFWQQELFRNFLSSLSSAILISNNTERTYTHFTATRNNKLYSCFGSLMPCNQFLVALIFDLTKKEDRMLKLHAIVFQILFNLWFYTSITPMELSKVFPRNMSNLKSILQYRMFCTNLTTSPQLIIYVMATSVALIIRKLSPLYL